MEGTAPKAIVLFRHCYVRIWNHEFLETVFPDGGTAPALFVVNDETKATAHGAGYGEDVARMHLEHELGHTFLSEHLGRPYSYVLKRVADQVPWTPDPVRLHEEAMLLAFQRYLNTEDWDELLCPIGDVAATAKAFKARFSVLRAA